jgi:hypothetical protein
MGLVVLMVVIWTGVQEMLRREAMATQVTFVQAPAAALYPDSREML